MATVETYSPCPGRSMNAARLQSWRGRAGYLGPATDAASNALTHGWQTGVPVQASALDARWWQLETWLRSLAYVELRARFGASWLDQIPKKVVGLAGREAQLAYMPSPDAELLVSYLDVFRSIRSPRAALGPVQPRPDRPDGMAGTSQGIAADQAPDRTLPPPAPR